MLGHGGSEGLSGPGDYQRKEQLPPSARRRRARTEAPEGDSPSVPRRAALPCRRRHLGREIARLELGELRRALDADGEEPGDLLADAQRFLVAVADIGERHVGEPVLAGRW